MLAIVPRRAEWRRLLRGRHVFFISAGMTGMIIVSCCGVVLMLCDGRRVRDHARTNAVAGAQQDRQRRKKCRLESAYDHVLTSLSVAVIYTPKGYMSTMENNV